MFRDVQRLTLDRAGDLRDTDRNLNSPPEETASNLNSWLTSTGSVLILIVVFPTSYACQTSLLIGSLGFICFGGLVPRTNEKRSPDLQSPNSITPSAFNASVSKGGET